ncbi:retrotransposon gag domain-containing protein, partial [Escherichia coli]|uniref:retrotransposon gag domain-containing protein n=1 Tax=Escherichia coli TaxID=562 RepID=UPI001C58B385
MNPIVLIRGEDGFLQDQEGQRRNAQGQRLDENGVVIMEEPGRYAMQRQEPAGRGRTLGEYNRPDEFYANRAAIRPPTFPRNDFELKPAYFALVAQHPFHGLASEHPMDHIERFEDLASRIKANGVSSDYLYCKLFPYSLNGEAAYWLKQLEPGSLTTWEDTKNAFL